MTKLLAILNLSIAVVIIGVSASKLPQNDKSAILTSEKMEGLNSLQNGEIKLMSPEEVKELLKQYPNATMFEPENITQKKDYATNRDNESYYTFMYIWGQSRSNRLAYITYHKYYYDELQNVYLFIEYPRIGIGAPIEEIFISVEQTDPWHRATIVSGGIGQQHVKILLEAWQTSYFMYNCLIYGTPTPRN